jgi:O-antigen/teichoic acid export membrane protein
LLLFFSREIVELTLGTGFGASVPIMMVLILGSVTAAGSIPYRMVLYAVERQRDLVVSSCLGLVILVLANALLVPDRLGSVTLGGWKGLGSAVAMMLMNLGSGLVQYQAAKRHAGITFYKRSGLILLAGISMYLAMVAVRAVVPAALVVRVFVCSLVGVTSYLATLAVLREFTRADVQVFLNVLHPRRMLAYVSEEVVSGRPDAEVKKP